MAESNNMESARRWFEEIWSQGKIIDRWGAFCFYDILADLELVPPFWELSQRLSSS